MHNVANVAHVKIQSSQGQSKRCKMLTIGSLFLSPTGVDFLLWKLYILIDEISKFTKPHELAYGNMLMYWVYVAQVVMYCVVFMTNCDKWQILS